ncbi:MAG: anaerobic sulfatase-maturating enzyme [Bacteroidetes bacterium]|nr:anaerobic sulfatase-maturating enzyme [Bacteroidota bacterium]
MRPLNLLLVKPAGPDCNLDCTYCFYLDRSGNGSSSHPHRMTDDVLEEMIRQALSGRERHMSFVWQGGEPTLMGLPFFRRVVELQQRYGAGKSVSNALQTNGLLLDEEWAVFLKQYHFLVGISIDGPEHVHDYYRRARGGQGSWSHAVSAARLLQARGVEVNAISVVTEYAACFPDEIYHAHRSLGLDFMQFIPCVETDPIDPTKAAAYSVTGDSYGRFLIRLFDLWRADFDGPVARTSIRYFDSVFHAYVGLDAPECTLMATCGVYLAVEHNGDVFACDFFVEPGWKLGNLMHGSLRDMINAPEQERFGRMKAELPVACRGCSWLRVCQGGCTKDRIRDPRDGGLSHFCNAYKMFFAHADRPLRELASTWSSRLR